MLGPVTYLVSFNTPPVIQGSYSVGSPTSWARGRTLDCHREVKVSMPGEQYQSPQGIYESSASPSFELLSPMTPKPMNGWVMMLG